MLNEDYPARIRLSQTEKANDILKCATPFLHISCICAVRFEMSTNLHSTSQFFSCFQPTLWQTVGWSV